MSASSDRPASRSATPIVLAVVGVLALGFCCASTVVLGGGVIFLRKARAPMAVVDDGPPPEPSARGDHDEIGGPEGADIPRADRLKALRDGKLTRPRKRPNAHSFVHIDGGGFVVGAGQTLDYTADQLELGRYGKGVRLTVDGWNVEFGGPRDQRLRAGEYLNAKRLPFNDNAPGLSFTGHGRGCNTVSGSFAVWEIELDGNQVRRLAIDFIQFCDGDRSPSTGMIRYNSHFE